MRVIAGVFGGRRLRAPRGVRTRPTADRVKEAIFSMLGPLEGARVLDLFAGTGALGIEALSRGAEMAVFVERDPAALAALRANLDVLRLSPPVARIRAVDSLAELRSIAADRDAGFDLVFLDPPYRQATKMEPVLQKEIAGVLAPAGRVVLESDRRSPLALELPIERERRYGDTSITIWRNRERCPEVDRSLSRLL